MTKLQCEEVTVKLYSFYMREIFMIEDFDLVADDLDQKDYTMLQNWTKLLDKKYGLESIGVGWLVNYMDRNFQYWHYVESGGGMRYGLRSLQLSWIIGKKAFTRYDEDLRHFYGTTLRVEFRKKLKFGILKEFFPKEKSRFTEIDETEEKEKQRYYGTEAALLWCLAETSLFNPKSELCLKCNFAQSCKNTLKKNFPKLHDKRNL